MILALPLPPPLSTPTFQPYIICTNTSSARPASILPLPLYLSSPPTPPLSNQTLREYVRRAVNYGYIAIVVAINITLAISLLHLSPHSLALFCKIGATYLQNCTYHKVLRSAANKAVLIIVSKEMYSPLNELSNGCLGLQ